MGDAAGKRSAEELVMKWNRMLDSLQAYRAGEMTAEEVIDDVTAYVVKTSTMKIGVSRDKR